MRLGLFGRGRLGRALAAEIALDPSLELGWAVDRGEEPAGPVDLAIDASSAEAVAGHLDWCLEHGADLLIGTTGWERAGLAELVGRRIGVLVAPNFSLGAALLRRLALVLGRFAALDGSLDPYLVEHHHAAKADAPSGTARLLAEALLAGCPSRSGWGQGAAGPGRLSIGVVRAGSRFGAHTVGLDGPSESLTLTHEARSRALFAAGALRAARWLRGRKGLYAFEDFAAELLDPLFRFGDRP